MNKITITVEGESGTGKSTVARQIAEQLKLAGMPVELNNPDAERTLGCHIKAMRSLIEHGIEIEINELQLPRE